MGHPAWDTRQGIDRYLRTRFWSSIQLDVLVADAQATTRPPADIPKSPPSGFEQARITGHFLHPTPLPQGLVESMRYVV